MLNELTLGERFSNVLVEAYQECPVEEDEWHNECDICEVIVRDSTAYIHLRYSPSCMEPCGGMKPGKAYIISGESPTRFHRPVGTFPHPCMACQGCPVSKVSYLDHATAGQVVCVQGHMSLLVTDNVKEDPSEGAPHRIREAEGHYQTPIRLAFSPAFDLSVRRRFFGKMLLWMRPSGLSSPSDEGSPPVLHVLLSNHPSSDCPFPIVSADGSESEMESANRCEGRLQQCCSNISCEHLVSHVIF